MQVKLNVLIVLTKCGHTERPAVSVAIGTRTSGRIIVQSLAALPCWTVSGSANQHILSNNDTKISTIRLATECLVPTDHTHTRTASSDQNCWAARQRSAGVDSGHRYCHIHHACSSAVCTPLSTAATNSIGTGPASILSQHSSVVANNSCCCWVLTRNYLYLCTAVGSIASHTLSPQQLVRVIYINKWGQR